MEVGSARAQRQASGDLVGQLHLQGIQFKSLTDAIDTASASGRKFLHVVASLADMGRELTVERTLAGGQLARKLGRRGGRKNQMTDSKLKSVRTLLANAVPPRDVARNLGGLRADRLPMVSGVLERLAYDLSGS